MGGVLRARILRRIGLGVLGAMTLILLAASRYAVPMGLGEPLAVAALDESYSAQLSGYVDVPGGEEHRVGISFDGPARLVIDGQLVAAMPRGGLEFSHSAVAEGVHLVMVQFQPGADADPPVVLQFLPAGGWAVPAPRSALSPRRLPRAAWILRRNLEWMTLTVALLWTVVGGMAAMRPARAWLARRLPPSGEQQRAVWALLAFSVAMFAYPLWWGVPLGWSEDELLPMQLDELRAMFVPGWHAKYPPLHMFLLTLASSPVLGAVALDMLDPASAAVYGAMKIVGNVLTVSMAVSITALVYLCASRATHHRVGLLAGLLWSLTLPAVYYAKTANLDIPYTFWFALALLAYQSAIDRNTVRAYLLFAAAAALSVVTKDQAYGLYLLPAVHLAVHRYRRLGSVRGFLGDGAMLGALATGFFVFAAVHNLFWNWQGFRAHVDLITGGASEGYRMVDSLSPAGQAWLLMRNVQQIAWSLSWPGALLALLGVLWGLGSPASRMRLLPFLLPGVSYYLTFIAVVGYTYDRFLIPLCVLLAVFAAVALDRLWPEGSARWRTALAAGVILFMALRTGSINQLMAADSRYEVQRWLRKNVPSQARVVVFENWALLPNLKPFGARSLTYPMHQLPAQRPEVVVLSDHYRLRFRADEPEHAWHEALMRGDLGYDVALRHRGLAPLAILAWERQFRSPDPAFSVLHKVNPGIIVLFRRD